MTIYTPTDHDNDNAPHYVFDFGIPVDADALSRLEEIKTRLGVHRDEEEKAERKAARRRFFVAVGTATVYVGGIALAAIAAKAKEEQSLVEHIDDLKDDVRRTQRDIEDYEAELRRIRARKAAKASRKAARKAAKS